MFRWLNVHIVTGKQDVYVSKWFAYDMLNFITTKNNPDSTEDAVETVSFCYIYLIYWLPYLIFEIKHIIWLNPHSQYLQKVS